MRATINKPQGYREPEQKPKIFVSWYEKPDQLQPANTSSQINNFKIAYITLIQHAQFSNKCFKIMLNLTLIFCFKYIATATHYGQSGYRRSCSLTFSRSFIDRIPCLKEYFNHFIHTKVFNRNELWEFEFLLFPFFFRIHLLEL